MATFPSDDLCITIEELPTIDKICFPGGFCLDYVWDGINKIPNAADLYMDYFSQVGPAMAPLQPFFSLLETVLALFNCVKAIPDAITSLNPTDLIKCIPELAEMIDKILKLIPQLSIPKMVIAIIKNVAALLRGIATDLAYLQAQAQRIADGIDRAADLNDYRLNGFLVCAQHTLDTQIGSTGQALAGLGGVILLVNIFMGLFGGPEIPCFGDLMSGNMSEGFDVVIDLLTDLATLLTDIANSIPDPDMALTLALGDSSC